MLKNLPQPPATPGPIPPIPSSSPPIKEEITSLELTPKSNRSKKLKIALIVFALFFLLASVPTAVYLVRQNQEVRKGAEDVYPPGCCENDSGSIRDCPSGQACDIPNGACGPGGISCNPKGSGFHKACVNNACVNVPGGGVDDECGVDNPCGSPPPPGGCTAPDGKTGNDGPGGCCGNFTSKEGNSCSSGDCRDEWEKCDISNGGCASGKSCCSTRGCANGSDCCSGKCQGGTCVGSGVLECHADETGVSVVNNTGSPVSGNVTWYSSLCAENPNCGCSGSSRSTPINLGTSDSDKTWSMPITGSGCAWQSDVAFSNCHNADNGCIPGCGGATPTPPTYNIACEFCRVYDSSWTRIIDFSTITVGQTVYFATTGSTTHAQGITKARFRINSSVWQETTNKHEDKFYIQYTIPSATTYTIESMVFNPTLGWY